MTNEEINIAIAKACGWESLAGDCDYGRHWKWRTQTGAIVSDPTEDLNSINEAENTLTEAQYSAFSDHLYDLAMEEYRKTGKWRWLCSGARLRAEAFFAHSKLVARIGIYPYCGPSLFLVY